MFPYLWRYRYIIMKRARKSPAYQIYFDFSLLLQRKIKIHVGKIGE